MKIMITGLELLKKSDQKKVKEMLNLMGNALDIDEYLVNLSFIDDDYMKDLVKRFKHKNNTTDVLSFPLAKLEASTPHSQYILGDVVISIDQAQKQAYDFTHSLCEEIAVLSAHGLIHLLGYDHEKSCKESDIQMQLEMYLLEMANVSPLLSLIGRI